MTSPITPKLNNERNVKGTLIYHLHRPHEIQLGRPNGTLETVPVPLDFLVYPGSPRDPHDGDPVTSFRYDQEFAFMQSIVEGHGDIPTFYDGMRCQAVIDAVLQSARERRRVDVAGVPSVTVPLAAVRQSSSL